MEGNTHQTVNYHFHIEGGQGTTINTSNDLHVAQKQVVNEKSNGADDESVIIDLLEQFARNNSSAIINSWTYVTHDFESERIKRGVKREDTISWSDLERHNTQERTIKLFEEAYRKGHLSILCFAFSKKNVPIWRKIQQNPKLKELFEDKA